VAARGQLAAERDGGEGVAGVAEGGEEDAPPRGAPLRGAQSISASSRMVCRRRSRSNSIGDTISVPTPAER
jgi:hypothetical protein